MQDSLQRRLIRPSALESRDAIAIIAPGGPISFEALEAGCARLERMGYRVIYEPSIFDRVSLFAGSVERRLREIHGMFENPEVRAILCSRGGYGCNYLLPHLDLNLIRANPKIFGGYSDNTSLLTYLCDTAGLVTFHAPMVTKDFAEPNGVDMEAWQAAVATGAAYDRNFGVDEVQPLRTGSADGFLYGGCLSLLCASLGTPYEIRTEGSIFFVEEVNEPAYRIDRMLMQLKLAGKLDAVQGIVFGEMLNCTPSPSESLQQMILRIVDRDIPIAYGLRSGHVSGRNFTLPFGVRAHLVVESNVRLSYEAAVMVLPRRSEK